MNTDIVNTAKEAILGWIEHVGITPGVWKQALESGEDVPLFNDLRDSFANYVLDEYVSWEFLSEEQQAEALECADGLIALCEDEEAMQEASADFYWREAVMCAEDELLAGV